MSGGAVLPFRLFPGRSSHSKATYTHPALLLNAIALLLLMGCHGRSGGGGIAMGAVTLDYSGFEQRHTAPTLPWALQPDLTIPASNNATLNRGSDEYTTKQAIFELQSIGQGDPEGIPPVDVDLLFSTIDFAEFDMMIEDPTGCPCDCICC